MLPSSAGITQIRFKGLGDGLPLSLLKGRHPWPIRIITHKEKSLIKFSKV